MPYRIKKSKDCDEYYVYGEDGKKHSKKPMKLEMAKKQMAALNIAHARKSGAVIPVPNKPKKSKVQIMARAVEPSKEEKKKPLSMDKMVENAVNLANVRSEKGIEHVSSSGLANDAGQPPKKAPVREPVYYAKPIEVEEKQERSEEPEKTEKPEKQKKTAEPKKSLLARREYQVSRYNAGYLPKDVPKNERVSYARFFKAMERDAPPKWYKP